MCGGSTVEYATIVAHHMGRDLELAKCNQCRTVTYEGDNPVIGYTGEEQDSDDCWIHYVQVGAGISSMLDPIKKAKCTGSLLDIGCGFGFIVDYWNRSTEHQAVGMELAYYGKVGKEKLGIPVYHALLGNCPDVDNQRFDIVFSSEVIEHVEDPAAFTAALRDRLNPGGCIVLTTPSVEAVYNEEVNESTRISTLSPFFHYFVASKLSLETLLKEAGFKHVIIQDNGVRLYAWASDKLIELEKGSGMDWNTYLGYLDELSDNPDKHIKSGALFRLTRDTWNLGQLDRAHQAYLKLEETASKDYGINLRTFTPPPAMETLSTDSYATLPGWLPLVLYFGATILSKYEASGYAPIRMLMSAEEMAQGYLKNEYLRQFSQETEHYLPKIKQQLAQQLQSLHTTVKAQTPRKKRRFGVF